MLIPEEMQKKVATQNQPTDNLYWTAEGEQGIITFFERKSKLSPVKQIKRTEEKFDRIYGLAQTYKTISAIRDSQPDGTRLKFKPLLNRIKYKAESMITKAEAVNDECFSIFGFKDRDFNKNRAFHNQITKFALNSLSEDFGLIELMKELAKDGKKVSYKLIETYTAESEEIWHNLKYKTLTEAEKQDSINRVVQLSDLINKELNLRNKEKSQRANLCYFLLYDDEIHSLKPEILEICEETDWNVELTEEHYCLIIDLDGVRSRISKLSKTNLKELVRIICEAHNIKCEQEIKNDRKKRKMEHNKARTPKKTFTAEETKQLVQSYKAEGKTQKQVAQLVEVSLRTVKRAWN